MPTYEYACAKCHQQFDIVQSIADSSLTVCPKDHCRMKKWGKGKVKRVIGAGAGLIFKGTGFYITDYRSDSYKEAAKKDSNAAASASASAAGTASRAESKAAAGGETKAAPKTEAKPAPAAPAKPSKSTK